MRVSRQWMRRVGRPITALLGATALVVAVPQAAHAATWAGAAVDPPKLVCSATAQTTGAGWKTCVETSPGGLMVRARAIAATSASRSIAATVVLSTVPGQASLTATCATRVFTAGNRLSCDTGWLAISRPTFYATATFTVSGVVRPKLRALSIPLAEGLAPQSSSTNCGPTAINAALRTMGLTSPSIAQISQETKSDVYGTLPGPMVDELNKYLPASDTRRYHASYLETSGLAGVIDAGAVVTSLNRGHVVIPLVRYSQLPWSGGSGGQNRHYLVVYGYGAVEGSVSGVPFDPERLYVWDPWDNTVRTLTMDQLYTAAAYAWPPVLDAPYVVWAP